MRMVTMSLAGLLVAAPLAAQEPQPEQQEEQERRHVVRTGDTLWDLANHYFQNPFRWRLIYNRNTDVVEDPHWIYPEEVLIIPGLMESVRAPERPVAAVRPLDRPVRTVFYREPIRRVGTDQPTVLSEPSLASVPVRPGEFHAAEFLADPDQLQVHGLMLRSRRNVDLRGRETRPTSHPKDDIYIAYARNRPAVGDRMMMVRVGRRIRDAGRGVRVIHPTAIVRITALQPEVMEAVIESQYGPVHMDQLLIPMELYPDFMDADAEPLETPDLDGQVLRFVTDQPLPGRTDRAFIDRGRRHGVQVGDVFAAYLPERRSRQRGSGEAFRYIEQLPEEAVAHLRVVRVGETTATVQVEQIRLPVLEDGIRVRRVRRMP